MPGLSDSDLSSAGDYLNTAGRGIVSGAHVCVKPNRRFPSFASGDKGIVLQVDTEAGCCAVLFEGRDVTPVAVAMKHLEIEELPDYMPSKSRDGSLLRPSSFDLPSGAAARRRGSPSSPAQRVFQIANAGSPLFGQSSLNESAAKGHAASSSTPIATRHRSDSPGTRGAFGSTFGRSSDADVAAERKVMEPLWAALEAQAAEQRRVYRTLEERIASCESSVKHRCHNDLLAADILEQVSAAKLRFAETNSSIKDGLHRTGNAIDGLERRARALEEAVTSSTTNLSQLDMLLDGKERRVAELSEAINRADDNAKRTGQLAARTDAEERHLEKLEKRFESFRRTVHTSQPGSIDTEPIWQALRELQELVVHESDSRAAGLREVLALVAQAGDKARSELAMNAADMEIRLQAEVKKLVMESARHAAQDGMIADCLQASTVKYEASPIQIISAGDRREARSRSPTPTQRQFEVLRTSSLSESQMLPGLQTFSSRPSSPSGSQRYPGLHASSHTVVSAAGATVRSQMPANGQLEDSRASSPSGSQIISSGSLKSLQKLESRFDRRSQSTMASSASAPELIPSPASYAYSGAIATDGSIGSRAITTEGSLGKLKGQLEGLCAELGRIPSETSQSSQIPNASLAPSVQSQVVYATTFTTAAVKAGSLALPVVSQAGFNLGDAVVIAGGTEKQEFAAIAGFSSLALQSPLKFDHEAGTSVCALLQATPVATPVVAPVATPVASPSASYVMPAQLLPSPSFTLPVQAPRWQASETTWLTKSQQRLPTPKPLSAEVTCRASSGDEVVATWADGNLYAATVESIHDDETITVSWKDGVDSHRRVASSKVFKDGVACSTIKVSRASIGDEVMATWADGSLYAATVESINDDETITVSWKDGVDSHRRVASSKVFKDGFACSKIKVAVVNPSSPTASARERCSSPLGTALRSMERLVSEMSTSEPLK